MVVATQCRGLLILLGCMSRMKVMSYVCLPTLVFLDQVLRVRWLFSAHNGAPLTNRDIKLACRESKEVVFLLECYFKMSVFKES